MTRSQATDPDSLKQPPIRVRQENLHLMNTKNLVNPRFYFNTQPTVYDPHNEVFNDFHIKLKQKSKNIIFTANSNNGMIYPLLSILGSFIVCLLQDGDFLMMRTKDKSLFTIKGIHKYETRKDDQTPSIYVNDDGSILVLRYPQQDFLWMWTMSKESQNQNLNLSSNQQTLTSSFLAQPKKGLFRSNSYDRRQQVAPSGADKTTLIEEKGFQQNQQETLLKGNWIRVLMKDQSGPYVGKTSSFQEGFDLKFINLSNRHASADAIKTIQARLFSKQEYFCSEDNKLTQSQQNSGQQDEQMLIEMSSQQIRVNFVKKGGTYFESSSSANQVKSKISSVDFITGGSNQNHQVKAHRNIITKLDNQCDLSVTVLNSQHMVYCQIIFTNFDTSFSTSIKLFDFVNPDDCPTFDNRGKTNLCIDDITWTNNDAFVIIIFNSCSFAVLPRLGSSLIAIYNPTLLNISQKMVDQFQHYKTPKRFNELILPMPIQQKNPQAKQIMVANQKTITMHPFEEAFLISDGHLCFIFRMEFEPELTDLFSKTNMSFFFVRFCISLDRLSVDPDILEKIPQLLTNKLPLFEFEKNAELDEEEDPGQIIMTASQINPYEHGGKRMETNQSFNADFTLDCQVVLLNLKHLLMGLRWNKNPPINYYQWLVTVVNDCFFYFLKNSEPVYAFHALRIAEAYCKKAIFATESDSDIDIFEARNQEFHTHRQKEDFTDFNQLKNFFDAVHDMYDYHNTKEYMNKTTAEKLLINYDMFNKMPMRITRGNGNWRFQFTKNYTLLVYYSLIQFRNYQAANFNILFLVFACYILQRYLDSMFLHHLQRTIEIVYRNFQLKKKSDDYELFLGKSGKNFIIGPPEKMKVYQDWATQVFKFGLDHVSSFYDQENMENMLDICINELNQESNEKIEKNIQYLGDNGKIVEIVQKLNNLREDRNIKNVLHDLRSMMKNYEEKEQQNKGIKVQEFNIGMSLYIILEYIRRNDILQKNQQMTIQNLFSGIQRMNIATSSSHCTNFVNEFSLIFDQYFTKSLSKQANLEQWSYQEEQSSLITKDLTKRQILSLAYFYLNDIIKGTEILNDCYDNKLFKVLMLSTAIKQSLKQMDQINLNGKEGENQQFYSALQITQFQQKANCIHTIRKSLSLLKVAFQEIYQSQNQDQEINYSNSVWACMNMLPSNASNILKEELAHQSIQKINKILKFTKHSNSILRQNYFLNNSSQDDNNQSDKYLLGQYLLKELFGEDADNYLKQMLSNEKIYNVLLQQIEFASLSLLNQNTDKLIVTIKEGEIALVDENSEPANEKSKQIGNLIIKNFKKFSKIVYYLTHFIKLQKYENEFQQQIRMKVFNQEIKIDIDNQFNYINHLLIISQFEKYQNSQLLISKAFNLLRNLINKDYEAQLLKMLKLISYQILNRSNKQKISQILEQCKQIQKTQNQSLSNFVAQLENLIFSENSSNSNPLVEQLKYFEKELIETFNNRLKIKQQMQKGENLTKRLKMILFERCLQARSIFGISFNYSFYFDKVIFGKRFGNIIGLNDQILDKYKLLLQKQEEKQKKQEFESLTTQHSIEKDEQNRNQSLQSSRNYPILESPGRMSNYMKSQDEAEESSHSKTIPSAEMVKGLMKNRQLGMPMTPKKSGQAIQGQLRQFLADADRKNKAGLKERSAVKTNDNSKVMRNQSIDFENREHGVAKILKITRRKNSVRRQFVFTGEQEEQKTNESSKQKVPQNPQKKAGHRKGQMSMNPQGVLQQQNFNFRNQKLLDGGYTTQNNNQQSSIQKSALPPGLPKGSQQSRRSNHPPKQKPNVSETKEQKLKQTISRVLNSRLKEFFFKWKSAVTKEKRVPPQQIPQQLKKGSFNLLLVKKEGDNYTVQDANQIMMKPKDQTLQNIANQDPRGQNQSMAAKQLVTAKPFEFIRIQNNSATIGDVKKSDKKPIIIKSLKKTNEEEKTQIKNEKNPFNVSSVKPQSKGSSKQSQKEQYLNFMQKFKQIAEKIDKVQKEANQLNNDFAKLN